MSGEPGRLGGDRPEPGQESVPRDVDREIESHIRMRAEELVAEGWDPDAAEREARRVFGDVDRVREECEDITRSNDRAAARARALDGLLQDLRYAVRSLLGNPGFTAVAVLTLALGIGANTAIFSVVNGVLLRPLPFEDPEQLVSVRESKEQSRSGMSVAWPNYVDWLEQNRSFAGIAAYSGGTQTILGVEPAVRAQTAGVSRDFWKVFSLAPVTGRFTAPDEHVPGGPPAAVVSHGFWRDVLGGRPVDDLVLEASGVSFQVVGVTPEDFSFPNETEIWYPAEPQVMSQSRTAHNYQVVGRLAEGVSPERADADLDAITRRVLAPEYGGGDDAWLADGALVIPLRERIAGSARTPLLLLFGAATLVLLVACSNLVSTLFARGTARAREIAVRSSLGATRGRLVRQLLTESVVLGVLGGFAGLLVAVALVRLLGALGPTSIPRLAEVGVDGTVMLFAAAVSLGTSMLFGLLPALRQSGREPASALRSGGRGNARDRGGVTWTALVGAEIALALLLLAGTGLLVRSFQRVVGEDVGFDAADVIVMDVNLSPNKYEAPADHLRLHETLVRELEARPGIARAGIVTSPPFASFVPNGQLELDGDMSKTTTGHYVVADDGYFEALDVPLLRGRLFSPADGIDDAHVAIVSQNFAEANWPGEDPIGKQVTGGGMDNFWEDRRFATVVGVVGDVRYQSLTREPEEVVYFPASQRPFRLQWSARVVAEAAAGDPGTLAPVLRDVMSAADPDAPPRLRTMDGLVDTSVAERRFVLLVFAGFGAVALILAMVGIYGVVSWSVARRTREMGIRLALGARPRGVRGMVIGGALRMVLGGLIVGAVTALAAGGVMESFLYGVEPADPTTLAVVVGLLLAAAIVAAWIPAMRSTRVDPLITMRAE